jgi:hypothetical protein
LEGRLAPSADAGFMSPELVAGWVGAAKGLYDDKPQMQRDEAIRSACPSKIFRKSCNN